jgi:hypothetical protein
MTAHPHPHGEKKSPPLSPSMLAGDNFIPSLTPCGEFIPTGSPSPRKRRVVINNVQSKKIFGGTKVNPWYNTDIKRTSTLVDVVLLRNIAGLVLSNPKKIQRRGK